MSSLCEVPFSQHVSKRYFPIILIEFKKSLCIVEVYMFGLRAPELIIILVVVLIIFGPKNLPKLGKSLGSTVKNIREGMEGDDKAETKQAEEVVVEQSEEDKEIAELEAKLAAAKKKQTEDSDADAE